MRFNIVMLLFAQLVMPVGFLANLAQTRTESQFELLLYTLVVVSYVVFIFITGRWDWFGYTLRFILLIFLCIVVFTTWNNASEQQWWSGIGQVNWVENVARLALFLTFAGLVGKASRGFRSPGNPIDVSFPLDNGTYYVAHGGSDAVINYHYTHTAQRFALDIVKLNKFGIRASAIYPKSLERYFIFNEPVLSPVEGRVLRSVDGLPDLTPPERDANAPAGNHVVIQPMGTEVYILLAHLKMGSVAVREGDHVHPGQILGRIGNSGNTTEPHLHIHCATIDGNDFTGGGTGIPLSFGGKFLKRNSIVSTRLDRTLP
ncbi:M23 family metallopeptidase [Candidatus Parcubacteria bacterium]|nr:MAG: M23 family metallopeptidase [Candidatus Parcubacteria bacterium]